MFYCVGNFVVPADRNDANNFTSVIIKQKHPSIITFTDHSASVSNITRITVPSALIVLMFIFFFWMKTKLSPQGKYVRNDRNQETGLSIDITIKGVLGHGSFSTVYKGVYEGSNVAVKIMDMTKYHRWVNEKAILYENNDHENVVKLIENEIRVVEQRKHLCLILEYADEGSLRAYLQCYTVGIEQSIYLMQTLVRAVSYIHSDHNESGIPKYPVIHHDIKSANVLLSRSKGCVLADFGLAIQYHHNEVDNEQKIKIVNYIQVGTPRYMSPEKLDVSLDMLDFENSLYKIDIYAMALVYYEIASRCFFVDSSGCLIKPDSYKVPYLDEVGNNPSVEDMKLVILEQNIRPKMPEYWKKNMALSTIQTMIEQSWHVIPKHRPLARDISRRIDILDGQLKNTHHSYIIKDI